jgi:hypothetical protein
MDVETRTTWRGKDFKLLTDEELLHAIKFCSDNYNELNKWAPISVWSYFSALLADLTIEQVRRLKR